MRKNPIEKTFREQKERELDRFRNIVAEKKKLTLEVEVLHHEVAELTEYKNVASKKLEQQSQLLKHKDIEHKKTKKELKEMRDLSEHHKNEVERLVHYRGELVREK